MVVIVLAGVVTFGLVGFYLNSQATWLDASSQALAQRDATLVTESVTTTAREAASFVIQPNPDNLHALVIFFRRDLSELGRFWWEPSDSLVHRGNGATDDGPVASSLVEQFEFAPDADSRLLHLELLQVRSTTGLRVQMSSTVAMHNVPTR
jgi:hypothetical protein